MQIFNGVNWQDVEYLEENWDGRVRIRTRGNINWEGPIDRDLPIISSFEMAKVNGVKLPKGGETVSSTPMPVSSGPRETGASSPRETGAKGSVRPLSLVPVLPNMPLKPGVPVLAEDRFQRISPATIQVIPDSDHVQVIWDEFGGSFRAREIHRSKLQIDPKVVAVLEKPGYSERFASRLERIESRERYTVYTKDQVGIRLPIPATAVRVTKETPLRPGEVGDQQPQPDRERSLVGCDGPGPELG